MWKLPAQGGGKPVQITRHGGFAPVESADGKFVYYSKNENARGLWKIPVEGGEETLVLEALELGFWGCWDLAGGGIYFGTSRPSIDFLSFATGRVKQVARLEAQFRLWTPGLSLSPDGRSILYTQFERPNSDITLVENFR